MLKICNVVVRVAAVALLAGMAGLSCSSSGGSQCGDAGCIDGGGAGLFGLSDGEYCYKVTGIAAGASDGCALDVASLVGQDLPATYTASTGTLSLGTQGSLGAGPISDNTGTLTRSGMVTDPTMTTCTWTQMDTSTVTLTADNKFTASIVEMESAFATACSGIPTGGTCTSTWSWTFAIDGSKSPSNGCK
jgi:hypothetical protein